MTEQRGSHLLGLLGIFALGMIIVGPLAAFFHARGMIFLLQYAGADGFVGWETFVGWVYVLVAVRSALMVGAGLCVLAQPTGWWLWTILLCLLAGAPLEYVTHVTLPQTIFGVRSTAWFAGATISEEPTTLKIVGAAAWSLLPAICLALFGVARIIARAFRSRANPMSVDR